MEIRAANFTQQAWKQKNFILHFGIIFSLYNSPSDMQYRLSINISVAFRAHTFPYSCFRYGARIRIYGRPVPYANWATRCPRFRRSSALCACRFRQLFFHELITRASPRLRTRVTCLFGWYAVKLALNSTRASNPDAQSAPLYKRFRTTEALYENIKSPRDGNSERDEWFFSTF